MANGAIYDLGFDLLNDFEPIALVATQPFLIDARKTMPANNLKELVAWLKPNADKATMGTSGVGSPSHIAGVLMEQLVGVKWQMMPYRSAGLADARICSPASPIMQLDTPAVSLPHVQSGALKAYAVTAKERIAVAPDIPTTDEAGLPGFYFSFWHAMWAPKGTPKAIIEKLNAAVDRRACRSGHVRKRLTDLAQIIYPPRAADARSAARLPEGRDREVVADHQGRRHQGAVRRFTGICRDRVAADRRRIRGLVLLLPLFFFFGRFVVADDAAGRGAEQAVMMREMAGDAADDRTLDAAFGIGRDGRLQAPGRQRRSAEQNAFA